MVYFDLNSIPLTFKVILLLNYFDDANFRFTLSQMEFKLSIFHS